MGLINFTDRIVLSIEIKKAHKNSGHKKKDSNNKSKASNCIAMPKDFQFNNNNYSQLLQEVYMIKYLRTYS